MTAMTAKRKRRINTRGMEIPRDLHDTLSRAARVLDLSTATYLSGLIAGAFNMGVADQCVMRAIDRNLVVERSAQVAGTSRWTIDPDGPQPTPGVIRQIPVMWIRGDGYRLHRVGRPRRGETIETGWHLTGPGIDSPEPMALRREEAVKRAEKFIQTLDAIHADDNEINVNRALAKYEETMGTEHDALARARSDVELP